MWLSPQPSPCLSRLPLQVVQFRRAATARALPGQAGEHHLSVNPEIPVVQVTKDPPVPISTHDPHADLSLITQLR